MKFIEFIIRGLILTSVVLLVRYLSGFNDLDLNIYQKIFVTSLIIINIFTFEAFVLRLIKPKHKTTYNIKKSIAILKEHNEWRRDNSFSMESKMTSPKVLGEAIDTIVEHYENK